MRKLTPINISSEEYVLYINHANDVLGITTYSSFKYLECDYDVEQLMTSDSYEDLYRISLSCSIVHI